jgi:2-oxoisovalerate dehydrogenase E2 component (dihydrolipoyl transacylase)
MHLSLGLCAPQEGDSVAEYDQLCEVQSDKATVEITSQYAGKVARLRHQPGDMVQARALPWQPLPNMQCVLA